MLKLRTMVAGSDPVGVGTVVTRDDPRVTGAGRVLRRTSLDEIPNLVNVLRGEMAIVGPRPTIPAQVIDYTPHQHRRHEVRPGITGWARSRAAPASPGRSGSSSTSGTSTTAAPLSTPASSPRPSGCWSPATASRRTRLRDDERPTRSLPAPLRARRRRGGAPLVQQPGGDQVAGGAAAELLAARKPRPGSGGRWTTPARTASTRSWSRATRSRSASPPSTASSARRRRSWAR